MYSTAHKRDESEIASDGHRDFKLNAAPLQINDLGNGVNKNSFLTPNNATTSAGRVDFALSHHNTPGSRSFEG